MRYTIPLLIALAVTVPVVAPAAEHTKDTLPTIKENIEKEKAVLVDVREKKEWDEGHIDGAVFLPLSAIQDGLSKDELAKLPKDKILYVHCVVGKRALTAGNVLEKHGFTVRPIKPGYKELLSAGLPKAKPAQD
jgi:phage shock protein E